MNSGSIGSLDRQAALARVGGDEELLKEIAALFLENYRAWMDEMRRAGSSGDAEALRRAAHGLKGSVANFGARDAVAASSHLEKLGRSGDLTGIEDSLAALDGALETLRDDLERL